MGSTQRGFILTKRHTSRPKLIVTAAVLLAAGALASCGGSGAASGEGGAEHTFRLAYYTPANNPYIEFGIDNFIERVEEETDGRISFEVYPDAQLGASTDSLEMLKSGVADLALYAVPYHPEELPLNQAFSLPLGLDARQMTSAMWRALHEDSVFKDELAEQGVVPLMVTPVAPAEISTVDAPIPDLDSLQDMRIRSASDIQSSVLKALGASPVVIPSPDLYTALERGTVDGVLYYFGSWKSISVQELLGHTTVNLHLVPAAGVNLGISESVWGTLSEEDQDILSEAGRLASMNYSDKQEPVSAAALEEFKADGLQTYEWPAEDVTEVNDILANVTSDWFADAEKNGYDAEQAQEQIEQFADEAKGSDELPSYVD